MSPRRRRVLAAAGASLLAGTAGCLTAVGRTPPVRAVSTPPTPRVPTGVEDAPARPVRTLAVGRRAWVPFGSHNRAVPVFVWNDADRERRFRLRLDLHDGGAVFDRTETIRAGASLAVDLREPNGYTLWLVDGEERPLAEIGPEWFDCNESRIDAAIRAGGRVESGGASTTGGCTVLSDVGPPL